MSRERIMVVDDDELVRSGLALDLENEGYEVVTAASGEEALAVLNDTPVQLILSDLVMAEMDGMDLLRRVHTKLPEVAFIVLTGHGTVNRALEAMRNGAHNFLQKPADPESIRRCVRAALDDVRLQRTMQTERRKAEKDRRERQRRLIRDHRMVSLGRLADGVSEYLSTTLDLVFRFGQDILNSLPEEHPANEHKENLNDSMRKMRSFIRDLQSVGHGSQLRVESIALDELVNAWFKSEEFAKLQRRTPQVRFGYHADSPLARISGSSTQLLALIRNLISHSLDGMPDGGVLDIELETVQRERSSMETGGRYTLLKIRDTAPNQPAQDMDRLFEPFQSRKVGDRTVSTGLALSVAYRIVQEHGGLIDVKAEAGRGTEYTVSFPVESYAAEVPSDVDSPYAGRETVLVLDDNDAHREVAVDILGQLGYRVLSAAGSQEALRLFRRARRQIDLAVVDLILGEPIDGVDIYKKILDIKPEQRGILVSGFTVFDRIVEAREMGLTTHVQKPYDTHTLGKAVREELDKK